jgi:LPS-assembly lipoprotein
MQRSRLFRPLTAIGLLCLLGACGFQLRGTGGTDLPEDWKKMYLITGNPNGELARELENTFSAYDVQWVEREEANYILSVAREKFQQRNLSINAAARAAEFELTMSTGFTVQDAEGETVIDSSQATVVKQMENDPSNVVGKTEEVRILKSEMRSELVQQILRRIGFFATSTP